MGPDVVAYVVLMWFSGLDVVLGGCKMDVVADVVTETQARSWGWSLGFHLPNGGWSGGCRLDMCQGPRRRAR